jgi:hypothetical protein
MATKNYALRPSDDGITYQTTFTNLGFKGLANLAGWTAFGAFVNEDTDARTYDNLTATIGTLNSSLGSVPIVCASPTAPMTAAKYRLEVTMVSPSGKKITGPSPDQDQTFITIRSHG